MKRIFLISVILSIFVSLCYAQAGFKENKQFIKLKIQLEHKIKDGELEIKSILKEDNYYFVGVQKWSGGEGEMEDIPQAYLLVCDKELNVIQEINLEADYFVELILDDIDGDIDRDAIVLCGCGANSIPIKVFMNKLNTDRKLELIFDAFFSYYSNFYHTRDLPPTIEGCVYPSEKWWKAIEEGKIGLSRPLLIFTWDGKKFAFNKEKSIGFEEDFEEGYRIEKENLRD